MLKKTLIATAAISATLLAAATLLPALAQSRSTASAGTCGHQRAGAGRRRDRPDKRALPTTAVPARAPAKSERGQDRRKAESSERDDRHGDEGRGGSSGTNKEKEKHKSRD